MSPEIFIVILLWLVVGGVCHTLRCRFGSGHLPTHPILMSCLFGPLEIFDLFKTFNHTPEPPRVQVVGLKPVCAKCKKELEVYGGLAFSPPVEDKTDKFHLCVECWDRFTKWLKRKV